MKAVLTSMFVLKFNSNIVMPSDEFRERVVRALEAVAQNTFIICVLLCAVVILLALK